MPPILLLIPVLELLGMLGFVYLASSTDELFIRYLPFVAAGATIVFLFAREAEAMTLQKLAIATVLLSVLTVAAFQIVGVVYAGLAKDVDPISFDNAARLTVVLVMALVAHGGLLVLCHFLRGHRRGH